VTLFAVIISIQIEKYEVVFSPTRKKCTLLCFTLYTSAKSNLCLRSMDRAAFKINYACEFRLKLLAGSYSTALSVQPVRYIHRRDPRLPPF
jgi:hypothetical protein